MSTKVAIVGAGGMMRYHLAGFRSAGAEVIAVVDRAAGAAASAARQHGIPYNYADVAAMLHAHPEVDAVSLIVPNKYHAPLALKVLQAGRHVFCEKPPALTAREAAVMAKAARAAKRTLMFDFNNRARPESLAIMEYIRQGAVGRINSAQAKWIRRTGIPGFGGWFTTRALAGGGALIDLIHMLDLALYFMGYPEPQYVLAQTFSDFIRDQRFKGPWGIPDRANGVSDVENAAHGFVKFAGGQVVTFQASWAEMVKREEAAVRFQGLNAGGMVQRLFGEDGLDDTALDTCELYVQEHGRSVNRSVVVPRDRSMGRERAAANFVHAIAGREAPLNSPDQAVTLMRIIDAAYASARTGRPVKC